MVLEETATLSFRLACSVYAHDESFVFSKWSTGIGLSHGCISLDGMVIEIPEGSELGDRLTSFIPVVMVLSNHMGFQLLSLYLPPFILVEFTDV